MINKLYVSNVIANTVVDGPGIRTSIYLSGCAHACKGCHNKETWNPRNGKEVTFQEIITELKKDPSDYGITISGGDPFYNAQNLLQLLKSLKKEFPQKNILVYTGYYIEQLTSKVAQECLKFIDILIDGPFEIEKINLNLEFRGSNNQRIIYLK